MKSHALSRLTRVVSAALILDTGQCLAEAPSAIAGAAVFDPGPCDKTFTDVPADSPFCAWIEQIEADGVIEDCGGTNFCPDQPVTRGALAMFLERAMKGTPTWDVDADLLDGLDSSAFVTADAMTWAASHRRFYLTFTGYTGAQATTACVPGYHMAALWEIYDVSQLTYDTSQGASRSDAGQGPPARMYGWVRTGLDANAGATEPGVANCNGWSDATADEKGTLIGLGALWWDYGNDDGGNDTVNRLGAWSGIAEPCNGTIAVWCVED